MRPRQAEAYVPVPDVGDLVAGVQPYGVVRAVHEGGGLMKIGEALAEIAGAILLFALAWGFVILMSCM